MKKEDVQKIQEVVRNVTRFAREHRTKIYITKLSNGNLVYDIGLEGIGTGTIDSLVNFDISDIYQVLQEERMQKKSIDYEIRIRKHWKYDTNCICIYQWK